MKSILPLIAVMTLASAGAVAQQQNPARQSPSQQSSQQQQNSQQLSPQQFVQNAESGTMYEISASQIAVRKTQDPTVRRFAFIMVRDHGRIGAALEETVAADRTVNLPAYTPMTSQQTQLIDALNSATGDDFDNTYVQQMVDDHRQALSLFENYARGGSDNRLKTFARRTVPIVRNHLQMVERLQKMESRASTPATTGRSSSTGRPARGNGMSAPSPTSEPMAPSNPADSGGGARPNPASGPAAPSGISR